MITYDFMIATVTEGYFKDRNVAVLSEENNICTCEISDSEEDVLIPKSSLRFWRSAQSVTVKDGVLQEVVWSN